MTATTDTPVGTIATEHPLATRVFARHQIDYCCGGGVPLAEACAKRGLDAAQVLAEIDAEVAPPDRPAVRWDEESLDAILEHLLSAYHQPLWAELPRLHQMAQKVFDVHGAKDPARLGALRDVVLALRGELEQHLMKEEQVLFPMIRSGAGRVPDGPVDVMMAEHDDAGDALRQIRELTNDFTVPAEACNTWRALWAGLEALERDLMEHIHLENNVLFPRLRSL